MTRILDWFCLRIAVQESIYLKLGRWFPAELLPGANSNGTIPSHLANPLDDIW